MSFCANCGQKLNDGAKFCPNCGTQTQNTENEQKQTNYGGQVHKCPQCGEIISAFETYCPACGMEVRGVSATNSVKELAEKLEQINAEKKNQGMLKTIFTNSFVNSNTEKQVSLISNFAIPNTREDLWEFLILASTNMNTSFEKIYNQSPAQKAISNAWQAKFDQAYQKAKLIFVNDPDFKRVEELYTAKDDEMKKSKKKSKKKITLVFASYIATSILLLILISLFCIDLSTPSPKDKIKAENDRLDAIVSEVYDCLDADNYILARAKATSIVFRYSNDSTSDDDEAAEQWARTREELLEIIDAAENGKDHSTIK